MYVSTDIIDKEQTIEFSTFIYIIGFYLTSVVQDNESYVR